MNRRSVIGSLLAIGFAPLGLRFARKAGESPGVANCRSGDGVVRGGCWSDEELAQLSAEENAIGGCGSPHYLSNEEYRERYGDEELTKLLRAEGDGFPPKPGGQYPLHSRWGHLAAPEAFWNVIDADLV